MHTDATFVDSDAVLTSEVDKHNHNFPEPNRTRSARHNIDVSVPVYQFRKRAAFPSGDVAFGKTAPSDPTVVGSARDCEIGAEKTGDDAIEITHFTMK